MTRIPHTSAPPEILRKEVTPIYKINTRVIKNVFGLNKNDVRLLILFLKLFKEDIDYHIGITNVELAKRLKISSITVAKSKNKLENTGLLDILVLDKGKGLLYAPKIKRRGKLNYFSLRLDRLEKLNFITINE
ncbi:hypothetical protein [Tenacibaculum dicentrarchi]|uniref:hypothetical protein n=1 Tax=Tenacibaculum dicentrarchi TaxID=669041 RepID=UPI0035127BC2